MMTTKATSGVSIAFPDVCKTPTPGGGVPIPYPNIATTAVKSQQSKIKISGAKVSVQTSVFHRSAGDVQGSVAKQEAMQLQSRLNQANARLQALKSADPNEWQKVLEEYAVLASALYRTLHPDA
jgi:hypothetical protein